MDDNGHVDRHEIRKSTFQPFGGKSLWNLKDCLEEDSNSNESGLNTPDNSRSKSNIDK